MCDPQTANMATCKDDFVKTYSMLTVAKKWQYVLTHWLVLWPTTSFLISYNFLSCCFHFNFTNIYFKKFLTFFFLFLEFIFLLYRFPSECPNIIFHVLLTSPFKYPKINFLKKYQLHLYKLTLISEQHHFSSFSSNYKSSEPF